MAVTTSASRSNQGSQDICGECCLAPPDARAQSGLAVHAVTDAAHRIDYVTGRAELLAQAADVGVDGAGLEVGRIVPHIREQLFAGLHAAFTL